MYIPKNRIKTNLYTSGGEYVIKLTDEEYSGYYHSFYTGQKFTGKTQNDSNIREIIPFSPEGGLGTNDKPLSEESTNTIALFLNDPDPEITSPASLTMEESDEYWNQGEIVTYLKTRGESTIDDQPRQMPQQFYPTPTEDDYMLGSFTRYFAVKINEIKYIELNEKTFKKMQKKDANLVWELFSVFSIQWTLTGDIDKIRITNRNQILIAEQKNKRLGLDLFLKNNYLAFYK
tara:strand:+ start:11716 stop:12411 length:696 start_codon:yes stop_codon:yes gene_type:complete